MTLTDPTVREALATLGQTFARQKIILDDLQKTLGGGQDIDKNSPNYHPDISKTKPGLTGE